MGEGLSGSREGLNLTDALQDNDEEFPEAFIVLHQKDLGALEVHGVAPGQDPTIGS